MNSHARTEQTSVEREGSASEEIVRELAQFRYALRRFLRFSETAARKHGITPQQHQLMLGIMGFTGRGSATISELAEFLQERHHSVVGLIERAEDGGLVRRTQDTTDRRVVNVTLTPQGRKILLDLTALHYGESKRFRGMLGDLRPTSSSSIEEQNGGRNSKRARSNLEHQKND